MTAAALICAFVSDLPRAFLHYWRQHRPFLNQDVPWNGRALTIY
jgi:hypothetical protein